MQVSNISKRLLDYKLIFVYLSCFLAFTVVSFSLNGFNFSKFNLLFIGLTMIAGGGVLFYSLNSKIEIHKTAFILLLIFGILIAFSSPIFVAPDESEHFARSDLTSEGVLFPEYVPNQGFYMNNYFWDMVYSMGSTVFNANFSHWDIWDGQGFFESVFAHNMFYAYLAQALGILIAKTLDLSIIWTLWLGRLFNLILYAAIISFSIKNTPKYKHLFLFIACLPLAVFQAASMSADSFIFAVAILNVSYFIRMYYSENRINTIDFIVFLISGLLIGLLKLPYIFLLFLIFVLPGNKFKSRNECILFNFISLALILIAMLYSVKYSSHVLLNSGRINYALQNNVSVHNQINYILSSPGNVLWVFVRDIVGSIYTLFIAELSFYHMIHVSGQFLFNIIVFLVFFIVSLFSKNSFSKKEKLSFLFVFLVVYVSTFLVQYLSWTPVGYGMIVGVQARYFIPVLILIPFMLGRGYNEKLDNYDDVLLMLIVLLLSGLLILTFVSFY